MAARITQQVVEMQSQLKHKDEELLKHKEEGFFHFLLILDQGIRCCSFGGFNYRGLAHCNLVVLCLFINSNPAGGGVTSQSRKNKKPQQSVGQQS